MSEKELKIMSKVTFDYSKTAKFINAEEVQSMSRIVGAAKQRTGK